MSQICVIDPWFCVIYVYQDSLMFRILILHTNGIRIIFMYQDGLMFRILILQTNCIRIICLHVLAITHESLCSLTRYHTSVVEICIDPFRSQRLGGV